MKFPTDRPVKVVMLGAGGTGGYVAPYVFRLLHTSLRAAARVPQLWNVGYSRCRRWRRKNGTTKACCKENWMGWMMNFPS